MRSSRLLACLGLLLVALAALGGPAALLAKPAAKQTVWRFDGTNSFEFQGRTIASAGDLDGDGLPDVVVVGLFTVAASNPGNKVSARVYSGKSGALLLTVNAPPLQAAASANP